jgi:hypothetical protein
MQHVKILIALTDECATEIICNNFRGLFCYKAYDIHGKWKY